MKWRFTIIDRFNNRTIIDEPIGWDSDILDINRDEKWHGVFFSRQSENLLYNGKGARIISAEYEQWGIQGIMFLELEEKCGNAWEFADRGKFVFGSYDNACGEKCWVKCAIEITGEVPTIRNRVDQKVNLDTLKSFDEVTNLIPYNNLPIEVELPSKGILLQDKAENDKRIPIDVAGVPANDNPGSGPFNNSEYGMVEFGMNQIVASEIGGFSFAENPFYQCSSTNAGTLGCLTAADGFYINPAVIPDPMFVVPLYVAPVVNYSEGFTNFGIISEKCDLDINISMDFENVNLTLRNGYTILCRLPKDLPGTSVSDYEWINVVYGSTMVYHDPEFILNPGDRIYFFHAMYHFKTEAQTLNTTDPAFRMYMVAGSFFRLKTLTHTGPTISKLYLINEAASRVVEAITDDKVRVYSEYFGRTDSQPYSMPEDGCGSMQAITNGFRIRQAENRIPDNPQQFTISLQDIFEGANPIHNIGIGLEPDPARVPLSRMRIEPWRFFYNDDIIMSCDNIALINKKCYPKNIYSTFQFGFNKWEAEEYNGLDEFLTKRFYRTTLSETSNPFVQVSKFVASGYAWEVTRRIGNKDSKDWRYDNDTFIVTLKRTQDFRVIFHSQGGINFIVIFYAGDPAIFAAATTLEVLGSALNDATYSVLYTFQQDGRIFFVTSSPVVEEEVYGVTFPNLVFPAGKFVDIGGIDTPSNIIDPDTIYNWKITPTRNAMRWMNRVLMSYKNFDNDAKIIFSDGDGNYQASGKNADANCRIENQIMDENETIDRTKFEFINDCRPFITAERIVFDYPFSTRDYHAVRANPYGLISFTGCRSGLGYIDRIKYDRSKGMANYSLIPKIIID